MTAESWSDLLQKVKDAERTLDLQKDEELWFRGVPRSTYQLLPSLLRCFAAKSSHEDVVNLETDLFFEFLAKARTNSGATLDHWDVLFLMQHYRAPTRLLDWTEVLLVALYFAVAYRTKEDDGTCPRLWIMNPYKWNQVNNGSRDLVWPRYFGYDSEEDYFYEYGELLVDRAIDWEAPVALYPPQRDARLSAQRGYFTIHGFDIRPLEQISPRLVMAVDLSPKAEAEVKEVLKHSGLNEFALFPDLEGLTRELKRKYETDLVRQKPLPAKRTSPRRRT